jgi:hypothetical protein
MTVYAYTRQPKTFAVSADLEVVYCSSRSARISMSSAVRPYTVVPYDPKNKNPYHIEANFKSSNYKCPVNDISVYTYGSSRVSLQRPCHPLLGCDRKVKYYANKQQQYTFRIRATALGRAYYYSPTMRIDVCDPNDMKAAPKAMIRRVLGLNSRTSSRVRDQYTISYTSHRKLLYTERCQLCSLRYYKFVDAKGQIDRDIVVDRYRNIQIKTSRPIRKNLRMVGYWPTSYLYGQCSKIMKENSIPVNVEVCGLEKVKLKSNDPIDYTFIIGKGDREVSLDGSKIRALFENDSKTCPFIYYDILRNEKGYRFGYTDPIFKYVSFDRRTLKLTVKNNQRRESRVEFFIRAYTAGRRMVYKKFSVKFEVFANDPPKFTSALTSPEISVKEVDQKSMSDKFFIYKSPIATDKEGDAIQMNVFSRFPCNCATFEIKSNHFVMKIDKSKLTSRDAGRQIVAVQLKDKFYADTLKRTIG